MSPRFLSIARPLFVAVAVLTAASSSASAQLAYDSEQYPFDFEQGGWVDEDAGLVWGYNSVCIYPILNVDFQSSMYFTQDYHIILFNEGRRLENLADNYQANGDAAAAAGDLDAAEWWWAKADPLYANADMHFAASVVADTEGFEWRLPTIDEAQEAHTKGLFNFPRNVTLDPADCDPRFNIWRWTSSGKGTKFRYMIQPSTGEVILNRVSGFGVPLVVRSLNPGSNDGGNGNGNGNGKGRNK